MNTLGQRLLFALMLLSAAVCVAVVPRAVGGARAWMVADDPVRLSEIGVEAAFTPEVAACEIDAALRADDHELAQSFLDLAAERDVSLPPSLHARVAAARAESASARNAAGRFVRGFAAGEPRDLTEFAGSFAGDLMLYGDVRDLVREGTRGLRGEAVDELVLGLAAVGVAVTAGTYASLGAGAPARAGFSLLKAAGRAGRIGPRMSAALLRPVRASGEARGLIAFAGEVGRVQARVGTRGALDAMRLADSPKDMTRLARLAEAKGAKTRAVLKLLGRGAIALTLGAFELASWILWAVFLLLGWCASLKRLTERAALRFIRRRKAARATTPLAA